MKRGDYTGWKEVFKFSFFQGIKDKSFWVFLGIMGLVILLGLPISTVMKNREDNELENSEVEQLLIYDQTEYNFDYSILFTDEAYGTRYENLSVVTVPGKSYEDATEAIKEEKSSKTALVKITFAPGEGFSMAFVKSSGAGFSNKDFDTLKADFVSDFYQIKKNALEVSDEEEAFINQPVLTEVKMAGGISEDGEIVYEDGKEKGNGVSLNEYSILLGGIMMVTFFISFTGGTVANSIVTEKSNRVVEYLMINVRPMALITGKIFASLLQVALQFAILGVCYGLSNLVTGMLTVDAPAEESAGVLSELYSIIGSTGPVNLLLCIAIILIGIMFFCIVAGLCGASVSKMEELAEGLKLYQMTMIGGSYIALGMCIAQLSSSINPWIVRIAGLIPIATPFVVPANLILGKISTGIAVISMVILLICTMALFKFTANVYESMIFYTGKVLKLKDIIQLAKNKKSGKESH